jgi:hypothetical protein
VAAGRRRRRARRAARGRLQVPLADRRVGHHVDRRGARRTAPDHLGRSRPRHCRGSRLDLCPTGRRRPCPHTEESWRASLSSRSPRRSRAPSAGRCATGSRTLKRQLKTARSPARADALAHRASNQRRQLSEAASAFGRSRVSAGAPETPPHQRSSGTSGPRRVSTAAQIRPREQRATDAGEAPRLLLPSESGGLDLGSRCSGHEMRSRAVVWDPARLGSGDRDRGFLAELMGRWRDGGGLAGPAASASAISLWFASLWFSALPGCGPCWPRCRRIARCDRPAARRCGGRARACWRPCWLRCRSSG